MLETFGLSDLGCVRATNEDYFITDDGAGIFILADGMGGANGGEFASKLSADTLHQYLRDVESFDPPQLEQGFLEAHQAVQQAARAHRELKGMGTTLIAALAKGDGQFTVASVGDSRAYLISQGEIRLLTQDQTWVAEIGARLGLSKECLDRHPMRHVLTMAIGIDSKLRMYSRTINVSPGDQILLCSDGLHGVINEKTLQDVLISEKSLSEKAHYLVKAAKQQGGPDNVTVVLIQVH